VEREAIAGAFGAANVVAYVNPLGGRLARLMRRR